MSDTINELKYLDDILSYLKTCPKNSSTLLKIFYNVYNEVFSEDGDTTASITQITDKNHTIDFTISNNYKMGKIQSAVNYLKDENLVTYNQHLREYALTFAGIVKITNNFVTTFEKEKVENDLRKKHLTSSIELSRMQKWTIWIAVTFSAIAIIVSVFSFFKKSSNTNYYRYYPIKKHETNPKILGRSIIEVKKPLEKVYDTHK